MVKVVPFKGYRYDEKVVGDLSFVVAPPYDVMKGKKLDRIQNLSENNIAWITKNKPLDGDTDENNQYTRARTLLDSWKDKGILKQDDTEAFYVYGQNFNVHGQDFFRFGFIGLLELEDFATAPPETGEFTGILQHEETLPKDIEDRLNLSRNTLAQFGQIFVIYPDHEMAVDAILKKNMKKDPIMDVLDEENIRHRLWNITSRHDIEDIYGLMDEKYVIIADGHHRYKTALALEKEKEEIPGVHYRMLTFVNMANTGLVILPTHRLIRNLEEFDKENLLQKLNEHFIVKEYDEKDAMFSDMNDGFEERKHIFGMFMDNGKYYSMELIDISIMDQLLENNSVELRTLDVSILHSLILDTMLGIDKKKVEQGTMKGDGFVVYIKGIGDAVDEAIAQVKADSQAVFFMNPTRIEEVEAVATKFECMPQKSTFFHPKVWTGFTINVIR